MTTQETASPAIDDEVLTSQHLPEIDPLIPRQTILKEVLHVSEPTLWRMERAGLFPRAVRISPRRVGYFRSAVLAYLAERRAATTK